MVLDFSIIVPTLNEERVIEKTLLHIKKQSTRASFEIIVVDGGSTDRTIEIAQKHVKVLKSPKQGKAYQLNYAAAYTDSKYMIFIDADTELPRDYVDGINTAFQQDPDLWACGAQFSYVGPASSIFYLFIALQALIAFVQFAFFHFIWFLVQRLLKTRHKIVNRYYFFNLGLFYYYLIRQFLGYPELSGSNICVRRKIFEEIGGFQQPVKLGVDTLFCHLVRTHIRNKGQGKMKILHSLMVKTDARHLAFQRSLKRLTTHLDFKEKKKEKN